MAGSKGDYAENAILEHLVGKTSLTMPVAYIGLSTSDPLDDGSGIMEPIGNGYARVQTAAIDWNSASGGSITNATAITFPQASGGDWGTITHFFVIDANAGGNLLYHGSLGVSKPVYDGDTMEFPAGQLTLTES